MTKLLAALPLMMAVAGCATTGTAAADVEPPVRGEGLCDAAAAATLVGQPATAALGAEVLRLTGARSLRWIQPGSAVTMDYRTDRANVELDAANLVTSVRCG